MPMIATAADAAANRRRGQAADGVTFWHTLYLGTSRYNRASGTPDPDPDALFPMAFLVEQDPGSVATAHYHQADQFQVVVDGHAMMGIHKADPITVHFAGAYSAYGPIRAGDEGVQYFTLRNRFDPGARFMSDQANRAALRTIHSRTHRETVVGPHPLTEAEGLRTLVPWEPDGLVAWRYTLGSGAPVAGPEPATGGGQYWLVLAGSLFCEVGSMGHLSCAFIRPDEAAFQGITGRDGLDVVVMQFPGSRTR
ncbi:MAG: hypothetical protein JO227_10835 [Acetobacteraceae bacterium]|nr:hypothetical protein [Acetobacteraceae bacterium]